MKNSKSLKSQFEQLVHAEPGPNVHLVAETIELSRLASVTGGFDDGGGGGGEVDAMNPGVAAYHR